jgi:hypothetical protein
MLLTSLSYDILELIYKQEKKIFSEALSHCRWKSVLKSQLNNINFINNYKFS